MALHGDVRVNNTRLYSWEAVRQGDLVDEDAVMTYVVQIHFPDRVEETEIAHRYSAGAEELIMWVMRFAQEVR